MQGEFQKIAQSGDLSGAIEELAKHAQEFARASILTTIASFLIASGLLGLIGARLRSDQSTNRFGPPDGPPQSDTFS